MDKKLIFENGREFFGNGFGADCDAVCEVVFNTSMVGYQEILSDPSCCGQMVCMTYPLIGNYGLNDEDFEARTPRLGGFIVREYNDDPSNFRYTKTLAETMGENGIPGIEGVDTREITKMLRDERNMRALLTDTGCDLQEGLERISGTAQARDQVKLVSCKKKWYSRTPNYRYSVVAVDCGIKHNVIRRLNEKGCNVTIVPYDTPMETLMALRPDGLFISNGPGHPEDVTHVIELIRSLQGKLPIFGICLGHSLIALANGAKVYKMKFGHRGGNHPVKNIETGKVEITSQNHSYAVDSGSLQGTSLHLSHINLLDNIIEGLRNDKQRILSVQYHPESAPGPRDGDYLFDVFLGHMQAHREESDA